MAYDWTLVTGASEGIGREFARVAASKGRNVVISARNEDRLTTLAEELRAAHGVEVAVVVADLTSAEDTVGLWAEATADGRRVDFLINNAGLGRNGPFDDAESHGGWDRELASLHVNVTALTALCKMALPHLQEAERARILNVASVSGFMPGPGMAVYNATKAYVISFSAALQAEMATTEVSVTALCPGATRSNFMRDAEMRSARVTRMTYMPTSAEVALAGWNAAIRGQGTYTYGFMNKMTTLAARALPRPVMAGVAKYMLART